MKDLSAEYAEKARELVRQGKATPEDVIMLDRIAKKYGFGLGDYKTAGIYADRIPHSAGHKKAIELGIQPSPAGPGPDLDTTKLKIKKTSDILIYPHFNYGHTGVTSRILRSTQYTF